MRTSKRSTLPLNVKKRKSLDELCRAYIHEKQYWLQRFRAWNLQAYLGRSRTVRDEALKQGYRSLNGLQARHWKLALEDAAETWDKYWQATFVNIRSKISHRKSLSETERHYAYWLLKSYSSFAAMMQGECPNPSFPIEDLTRRHIAGYVRRLTKKFKGQAPLMKKSRSVRFDANCYELLEHKERQYIKLMSLTPGKRIVLPLLGKAVIAGTITLVFSAECVALHIPQELKKKTLPKAPPEAIDFGYTEVMTDTQGIRYGTQFGLHLTQGTEHRHQKMQKRHKLRALAKNSSHPERTKSIQRYNLGKKKLLANTKRLHAILEKEINTAINELIETKKPSILITEDLHHAFRYDNSKKMNRKLSNWLKGKLQDRIAFKALAEGFRHEQVNPAYGSQSCPHCEFVDQRNRKGDRFQCLYCGHENSSDRIAALNYARRFGDLEIERYTPYRQVKTILLDRFHRRLETEQSVTVPGRTLETAIVMDPPSLSRLNITAGREKPRKPGGQSESETKNKHVLTRF